ncbi:MAG: type II toxin-antitoxin system RelE/ParE family toxin [Flavobacteriales bacterium]|nr:type II toxin-antitoxin system RelE/ParE family toxin [Flavobacteriales bacterium]MEB2341084.1 type II toxin-antitoxin system RelE/ParE family toxin [Flavobacteriia bacterium]
MRAYALVVRDEAQEEAEAIKLWYEGQSPGLGERFTNALERTLRQIRDTPSFQVRKGIYRHVLVRGFSRYRVVYTVDDDVITIYQVRHTSRKPSSRFGP